VQFSEPAQLSVAMTASFEASGVAMLIIDSKRRFVEVNQAACTLLGMDRGAIVGSTIDVLTPAERRHEIETRWDAFLLAGTQGGTFAY
jgi:PAS domain S-box-containing protein